MSSFVEGEIEIAFADNWHAEKFDNPGVSWPKGVSPVDFVAEGPSETVLVEIKDPSATAVPSDQADEFVKKMQTKELTHNNLVPKARSSYGFLHLMKRDEKPMRYVVVIGIEKLSVQPALLLNLTDRLRSRLASETDVPWKRKYIRDCVVVPVADVGKAIPGCEAQRTQILATDDPP